MTAIQILEKLGANASFDPNLLSEEDNKSIEQVLSDTKTFNAIQSHSPAEDEEEDTREEEEEEKSPK